jgi:hypothetical protein
MGTASQLRQFRPLRRDLQATEKPERLPSHLISFFVEQGGAEIQRTHARSL